jgi:putative FmdB family regulatory protein
VPIFDFECRSCGCEFEALVLHNTTAECPTCHGRDLERRFSSFAVSSSEKTQAAATKARTKAAATARRDNAAMEREIQEHRNEDH